MRGVLMALAAALAGCAIPAAPAPVVLLTPGGPALDTAKVRISVAKGQVRVDSETGLAQVDFADASAHVRFAGGQRLSVGFDADSNIFHVEILEDADGAIDIFLGETLIHVTKGDVFDAFVLGEHMEIVVRRGVVQVTGPGGRSQEVTQASPQILVSGGGRGAIHGVPAPTPLRPSKVKGPPREPRRPLILDRTDIAPAP